MMCYRDMTFCNFFDTCKDGDTCHRRLSNHVIESADRADMPISQFTDKPDCYKEKS